MMGTFTRRSIALISTMLMMLALSAPGLSAQETGVPWNEADFSAHANSTNIHLDAVELLDDDGSTRLADVDVGFTGATVDTVNLDYDLDNEMGRLVQPPTGDDTLDGQNSYGRASTAEIGLGTETPQGEAILQLPDLVWASAPPSDTSEATLLEVPGDPLVSAEVLSAYAEANWADDHCILGQPLSAGESTAVDLRLLDSAAVAGDDDDDGDTEDGLDQPLISVTGDDPDRATIDSRSHTFLGPVHDAPELGAAPYAEARQTLAPVTLFEGQDAEVTIEVLGEWVLWATAGGEPGTAHVHYGPAETSPETPVLRIIDADGEILGQLTFQDLLSDEGLGLELGTEDLGFLANISLGEPATTEIADDGTYAAASVDVVSVQLLEAPGVFEGADLRIGHMEVEVENEGGPITCEAPMDKIVDPETVEAGDEFTFEITVENPFACDIVGDVVDIISVEDGNPSWTVIGTDPEADEVSDDLIIWRDVEVPAGGSAVFAIHLEAASDSAAGTLRNDAFLDDAECQGGPVGGDSSVTTDVPVVGHGSVVGPGTEIGPGAGAAAQPAVLPATGGGNAAALISLLLVAAALTLRGRLFATSSESEREG